MTPVSGAVVLETDAEYTRAALTPPDAAAVPTIPEPSTWMFLIVAALAFAWTGDKTPPRTMQNAAPHSFGCGGLLERRRELAARLPRSFRRAATRARGGGAGRARVCAEPRDCGSAPARSDGAAHHPAVHLHAGRHPRATALRIPAVSPCCLLPSRTRPRVVRAVLNEMPMLPSSIRPRIRSP